MVYGIGLDLLYIQYQSTR